MDSLKFIGMSICLTTVVTSIFTMLLPNSKLDNVIKFAITLFFLTSIITPFLDNDLKLDLKTLSKDLTVQNTQTLEVQISNSFIEIAKTILENEIQELLEKNEIITKKVSIDINILNDTSIYIEKVKIHIEINDEETINSKSIEVINSIINQEIGIEPEIIFIK